MKVHYTHTLQLHYNFTHCSLHYASLHEWAAAFLFQHEVMRIGCLSRCLIILVPMNGRVISLIVQWANEFIIVYDIVAFWHGTLLYLWMCALHNQVNSAVATGLHWVKMAICHWSYITHWPLRRAPSKTLRTHEQTIWGK